MRNRFHPSTRYGKPAGHLVCAIAFGFIAQAAAADYAGTYIGTFAGSDHGSLTVVVDQYDAVTCDFFSAVTHTHALLTGGIDIPSVVDFTCNSQSPVDVYWSAGGNNSGESDPQTLTGVWVNTDLSTGNGGQGSLTVTRAEVVFSNGFD